MLKDESRILLYFKKDEIKFLIFQLGMMFTLKKKSFFYPLMSLIGSCLITSTYDVQASSYKSLPESLKTYYEPKDQSLLNLLTKSNVACWTTGIL